MAKLLNLFRQFIRSCLVSAESGRIVKLFHWKKVTTMIDHQQAQVAWSEVIEELDSDTFNRLRHALELVDAYIRQGTEIERGL